MALSDADVQKQIHHMMAFIEQEANEKAEEIDARAEEEFTIEKGRLVQQNRLKIIEYYERKEKQVELQKKIGASNLLNKSRLEVLKAQESHIKNVLYEAQHKLNPISQDHAAYSKLLEDLLCQGLCQMLEPHLTVRCRRADQTVVEQAIVRALTVYKNISGRDSKLEIDTNNWLPADICGGIELVTNGNRIKISNTLEARLEMLSEQMLPEIRAMLFGANPNRKFDN
ncbi:V-type proton ATPase subunit E-like [Homarus americanus]|uniref:V-type proton ATPase subunit E-like n=1 Tax=Homarus americanus TaxID=6706 RepID=UPI001C458D30|nr:V-type proton ATPase subunit E-like [Homarus americanus]